MTQHVLITGASQGVGKATALRFAQADWQVTLTARSSDRLATAAEEIQAAGGGAFWVPADVGRADQVAELVDKAQAIAPIDVLVNNAGICLSGPAVHTSLDDWRQILETNLWGCIHTIQAVLPAMLARGSGIIINVGSFGGKMPLPHMSAYCTSKYAVTGLTESLRLELAPQGIHVGIVHPGVINSDFLERAAFRGETEGEAESQRQQMAEMLQSGWVSQPEDIAAAIWKAVTQRQNEVVVGPAAVATELNRLFPQLTQWALAQSVGR